ncbi:MAG: hypothetical protein MUP71_05815 [Candidatus Aminicenantes bacterium]|nr:hypothetical protein [Candidatus Aminicenantes bacterium]
MNAISSEERISSKLTHCQGENEGREREEKGKRKGRKREERGKKKKEIKSPINTSAVL